MKHLEVACAVIVNSKNQVFVCQRGKGKLLEDTWEFPGGKIETNETFEQTIIREIKEELNSIVKPYKYLGKVDHIYASNNSFSISLYAYLCELIDGELTLLEHKESKLININEIDKIA